MARFIQGDRPEAGAELAMTGWKLARLFLGAALERPSDELYYQKRKVRPFRSHSLSSFILATPARRNPSSSAAEAETSITRPRINAPRSTAVTITIPPLSRLAPRTCLPNRRGLLAAIIPLCYALV